MSAGSRSDVPDLPPSEDFLDVERGGHEAAQPAGAGYSGGRGVDFDSDWTGAAEGPLELDFGADVRSAPSALPPSAPSSMDADAPPIPPSGAVQNAPPLAPEPSDSSAAPSERIVDASAGGAPPDASANAANEAHVTQAAHDDEPDAATIIAGYPPAPGRLVDAPTYALLVTLRQYELRRDLVSLRRRRSPDVRLYEAALFAHDARAFRLGLIVIAVGCAVLVALFSLPLVIRALSAN